MGNSGKRAVSTLLGAVALAAAVAPAAVADDPVAVSGGFVLDTGTAVEGAAVELRHGETVVARSATAADGTFSVAVPPGPATLIATFRPGATDARPAFSLTLDLTIGSTPATVSHRVPTTTVGVTAVDEEARPVADATVAFVDEGCAVDTGVLVTGASAAPAELCGDLQATRTGADGRAVRAVVRGVPGSLNVLPPSGSGLDPVTVPAEPGRLTRAVLPWSDVEPPQTTVDKAPAPVVTAATPLTGSATDDGSGIRDVHVTFDPDNADAVTVAATVTCKDARRRTCTWSASPSARTAGFGTAYVTATDRHGRRQPLPAIAYVATVTAGAAGI